MADSKNDKRSSNSPMKWFREAKSEFKKVTWPAPKQTLRNTSVVLAVLVVAGASIWGLDKLLAFGFKKMLGIE